MAKTTVHFSIVNYSKADLGVLKNSVGPALLDLYGTFHNVPEIITTNDKPYDFTLEASEHAIGGLVYYKRAQPSEVLAFMVCAAEQNDIKNVVKCVSNLAHVTVECIISSGVNEPSCTITLKDM
jgi:hypothetical protein